jgi:SOS-response transcriptional repressor LexA
MNMNELEIAQVRIEALKAAIDKLCDGNRTAFGRRLGYKDGAFVRQMLSGDRPITEKTIRTIEAIPGMRGWFSKVVTDEARATHPQGEHKRNEVDAPNSGKKGGLIAGLPARPGLTMAKTTKSGAKKKGTYPLISWLQAGTWETIVDHFAYDDAEDWLDSPILASEKSYYLRVPGESMYDPADHKSFREGEIVLVDPNGVVEHRKFVIALFAGEAEPILRQLMYEGEHVYLKAINPAWPNRIVEVGENVKILGVVRTKIVTYD